MRTPNTLTLALLLCAAPVLAQEDPTKPAPQLKKFAPLVGSWEASGTMRQTANAPTSPWTSTSTARWVLGGHFLQEDIEIDLGEQGGTLAFRNFYGWDRENERYLVFEISNFGSADVMEIHWPADDTMVYARSGVEMGEFSVERWKTKIGDGKLTFRGETAMGVGEFFVHVDGSAKRTNAKAREVKTVNAAFMPEMNAAVGKMKPLAAVSGTYKVEGWMIQPGMPKMNITAVEKLDWIFGGTVLEFRLEADPVPEMAGMPGYRAWGCWAWDDQAKCMKSLWLSNYGEIGEDYVRRSGDKFIVTSSALNQGQPQAMRAIIELDEAGGITRYSAHTMHGEGDPVHSFESTYVKQN